MFKKHKVIMLPVNNDGKGIYQTAVHKKLYYFNNRLENSATACHLYILSDEEVKKGDIILTDKNEIFRARCFGKFSLSEKFVYPYSKKIVASTDKSLGVALIPDEFVKLYCEKGGIDEVMVKYEHFLKEPDIPGGYIYTIKDGIMQGFSNTTLPIEEMYSKGYTDFFRLKVLPDNTITIKSVKNSWNREELIAFALKAFVTGGLVVQEQNQDLTFEKWIEENL